LASVGKHLVLELKDCDRKRISDCDFLQETLLAACTVAGATILSNSFHSFPPYGGVSGVVIIAESHFSIHTWPEYCYAAIDIFTCGDSLQSEKAVELLVRELQAKDHSILVLDRGIINSLVES
jgi:S-adenosylmethionine decarboxylase